MKAKEKKANGEGTIFFIEKEKRWRAEITWVDSYGVTHRKCFKAKKQTEVKARLAAFKLELLQNGAPPQPEELTFRDFADEWVETVLKPKVKPLSYQRKLTTLENQVYPIIGGVKVNKLTHAQIQGMINALTEKGLSYSTVKKAYEAVSACVRFYRLKNATAFNPCEGITLPENIRKDASEIDFFTAEQRKAIYQEATRQHGSGKSIYRLGWAYVLLMYSGLRVGELCALTWRDIDFESKTITVNKNAVEIRCEEEGAPRTRLITQNSTKTKSGNRIVPLTERARLALSELKKVTGEYEHIIVSSNGQRIRPARLDRTFYKILAAVGIEQKGVHALRHTFATMLFYNGCDVKIVSELLGHSNTKITENIYIHLIQQQKVKAISAIDQYSD